MSEENKSTPDLSLVISVLMENPDVLEKISSLLKGNSEAQTAAPTVSEQKEASADTASTYESPIPDAKRSRRAQLLGALKPYVKRERAAAIDSVIAIADIMDMMRRK